MPKQSMWKTLSCDLTPDEINLYSQELAVTTTEQAEIEAEKKEVLSTFTARLNKCIADGRVLARKITTKKEDRQVECDLDFDYARGMVYTVRTDTGVTIAQRKLSDEERQEWLDLDGEQDEQELSNQGENIPKNIPESDCEPCPKCEGDGYYIEDGLDDAGGEVFCDCPAGIAAREENKPTDPTCQRCHEAHPECGSCCELCKDQCNLSQTCLLKEAEEEKQTEKPTVNELMLWGYNHNEAKILAAGFSLVKYDREAKQLFISAEDPRGGWLLLPERETFAAAERDLEQMIADGSINVAGNHKGTVAGHKCMHRLRAAGFEFYRNGGDRIKYGDSWKTWKRFDDSIDCLTAWEELLSTDPKALED